MVYLDPTELKWLPLVKTWVQKLPDDIFIPEYQQLIIDLFEQYFENALIFFRRSCDHAIAQVRSYSFYQVS